MKSRAPHALPLLLELGVERRLELVAAGLEPALAEALVDLRRHLVHRELDHRDEGRRGLQERREAQAGDRELGRLQLVEAAAQVDQHQVALVAEERHRHARSFGPAAHGG